MRCAPSHAPVLALPTADQPRPVSRSVRCHLPVGSPPRSLPGASSNITVHEFVNAVCLALSLPLSCYSYPSWVRLPRPSAWTCFSGQHSLWAVYYPTASLARTRGVAVDQAFRVSQET